MWLKMVKAAQGKDGAFYTSKRATADFFFKRLLPESHAYYAKVMAGSESLMAPTPEQF